MTIAAGSPADWLRHARSDLAVARLGEAPGVLLETLCFHAQQAAEKALKAILVAKGVTPPRTHNIQSLLELIAADERVPSELSGAAVLTDYAVTSRYPTTAESFGADEYHEALRLAEAVLEWAQGLV